MRRSIGCNLGGHDPPYLAPSADMATAFPFAALQAQLDHAISRISSARVIARAIIDAKGSSDMSITGADNFAALLKDRLVAAKGRIAKAQQRMGDAVGHVEQLAPTAEDVAQQAEAEVALLESELRQLSNSFGEKA